MTPPPVSVPQALVDDTDSRIKYTGTWVQINTSDPTAIYGTQHVFFQDADPQLDTVGFTFEYEGKDFSLSIVGIGNMSCTVDNEEQAVVPIVSPNSLLCTRKGDSFQDGAHRVNVTISRKDQGQPAIILDSLSYTISNSTKAVEDVLLPVPQTNLHVKNTANKSTMQLPGDMLDLEFIGYSMGLYANFAYNASQTSPITMQYTIDDGPTVSFIVSNPTNANNAAVFDSLILQTARYPLGSHRLHLEVIEPSSPDSVAVFPDIFLVQNTTSRILTAVPSVPSVPSSVQTPTGSTNTSSPPSPASHLHSHVVIIVLSTVIPLLVVLMIILVIAWHRRRRIHDIRETFATPNPSARPFRKGSPEPERKQRRVQGSRSGGEVVHNNSSTTQVEYRVHEDGGAVPHTQLTPTVIDLPPTYDAVPAPVLHSS